MKVQTLIVDDSDSFRALLKKRLMGIGCWVVAEAGTAKEGLERFRELRPNLVTLDVMMPDEPGFTAKELFRSIRQEQPQTQIAVISMGPRIPTAADFINQGALMYLEKSFMNFDQLRRKLETVFPNLK